MAKSLPTLSVLFLRSVLILLVMAAAVFGTVHATEPPPPLKEQSIPLPLDDLPPFVEHRGGEISVDPTDGGAVLVVGSLSDRKISNRETEESIRFRLLEIRSPAIDQPIYGIRGKLRYEGVLGEGYLELVSDFVKPIRGQSSSSVRTFADSGPAELLRGDSDWREFVLATTLEPPVEGTVDAVLLRPERLHLGLVLVGKGVVRLKGLELFQYSTGLPLPATEGVNWWSERKTIEIWSGIATSATVLCFVYAVLAFFGRTTFVEEWLPKCMLIFSLVLLAVGGYAVVTRQPRHVFSPMLIVGSTLFCGAVLELRRLNSLRKSGVDAVER